MSADDTAIGDDTAETGHGSGEPPPADEPDPILEEVRLALGMNGGVSLAVWMGGVAVELDRARRAHLGPAPAAGSVPPLSIYHWICKAFHRSLVPDIMSGASAGGLNGTLLAAVLRTGRCLPAGVMREKWIGLGDFSKLLEPLSESQPRSLMQGGTSQADGGVFYTGVKAIFDGILDPTNSDYGPPSGEAAAPAVDALLDVTMTNIAGEPRRFNDMWGQEFAAREYRAPFRFRNDADFTAENLATAARASASFPVAFEPFRVVGSASGLAGFQGARYALDGGLLENAPIDAAIRLIPSRPAAGDVTRIVVYVNPEALTADPANPDPIEPELASVLGDVVNLPRNARFVDQLYAVEEAKRKARFAALAQPDLIGLPWEALSEIATALLPTYRTRRLLRALDDLLGEPGPVEAAASPADPAGIPWLPADLSPPTTAADWRWGISAAERLLLLEIDLVRESVTGATDPAERQAIFEARTAIFDALTKVTQRREEAEAMAAAAVAAGGDPIDALDAVNEGFRTEVYDAVMTATEEFVRLTGFEQAAGSERKGDPTPAQRFLMRGLAIEVVRRTFSTDEDTETAQQLSFVQLAPFAPTLIFTPTPFRACAPSEVRPDSGEHKLTGIRLMHFSGFYRGSWRANDFMWGRLDGATRVVDLLVDPARAARVVELGGEPPAPGLAAAIVSAADGAAYAEEALDDATASGSGVSSAVLTALGGTDDLPLVNRLELAIAADLSDAGGGSFTRTICERAVQLEILRDELSVLDTQTKADAKLGAYMRPLDLPDGLGPQIDAIRALYAAGETLPARLGRDDPREMNSDLALQTIARTLIVAFAALRGVNVTFGKAIGVLRAVLLPITGITSREFWDRFWTGVGFTAAATYIGARLASPASLPNGAASASGHPGIPLGSLWSPGVLLAWISTLAIVGVAVVPWLRALRNRDASLQRVAQAAFAVLLVALPLGVPIVLAHWWGHQHFAQIVATRSAFQLPDSLSLIAIGVVVAGAPILRLKVTGIVTEVFQRLLRWLSLTWLIGLATAPVAVWSTWHLGRVLWDHAFHWPFWVAAASLASAVACALYLWPWVSAFVQPKVSAIPEVVRKFTARNAESPG